MMATAEQMQEVLQKQQHELQVLTARMAALETQLQFESARGSDSGTRKRGDSDSGDDAPRAW